MVPRPVVAGVQPPPPWVSLSLPLCYNPISPQAGCISIVMHADSRQDRRF
jgi:hypothetical protein